MADDSDSRREEVLDELARIRDAYEAAERVGDFGPLADHVADDVVVQAPGTEPVAGRAAWRDLFDDVMADAPDRNYEITYESHEVLLRGDLAIDRGDLAIDRGVATDSFLAEEGAEEHRYNYTFIHRETPGGGWVLYRVIYNRIE